MFKYYGKLPDEVGQQNPVRLFYVLYGNPDEESETYDGDNSYLRMFYGI